MKHKTGFLYMMRNNRNKMIKIGFSKNPKYREKTLQSEEPEVELITYWRGTTKDEESLHKKFAYRRVRGEWFKLTRKEFNIAESSMMGISAGIDWLDSYVQALDNKMAENFQ